MKRLLAIVMAIVMLLSVMPTLALATEEGNEQEVPQAPAGQEEPNEEPTEAPEEELGLFAARVNALAEYGGSLSTGYGTFSYETGGQTVTLKIYVNNSNVSTTVIDDVQLVANTATFTVASGLDYHIDRTSVTGGSWSSGSGDTQRSGTLTLVAGQGPWTIHIYLIAPCTVTVSYVYTDNSHLNSDIPTLTGYTRKVYYGEEFKSNEWSYYDAGDARNAYGHAVRNTTASTAVDVHGTAGTGYYFKETITGDTTFTVTFTSANTNDLLAVDAYLHRGGDAIGFDTYLERTYRYYGYTVSNNNGTDLVYILRDGGLQSASSTNSLGSAAMFVNDNTQYAFAYCGLGMNLGHVKDIYYDSSDQNWYYIYRWDTNLSLIDVSWTNTVGPIIIPASENGRLNFVYKEYESDHRLVYNANGGSNAPATQTRKTSDYSVDFTVSTQEPVRDGHNFLGWAESASATTPTYQGGDTIAVTGTTTLYAVWREMPKDLNYTVNHVVDSESGTLLLSEDCTASVPYSATGYTVDGVTPGTFPGYKLKSAPEFPVTVTEGDTIYLIYEVDETQTKELHYTVKYVLDSTAGTELATESKTVSIWAGADSYDVPSVDSKTFPGYKIKSAPEFPVTVAEGDSVYVIYEVDEEDRKDLHYTVKYVLGSTTGTELASEDKTVSIWAGDSTYSVTAVESKTFTGYKVKTNPTLPATVSEGDTLYVIYEEDYEQTKELTYAIQHIVDGEVKDTDSITVDIWVNADSYIVSSVTPKTYEGYGLVSFYYDQNVYSNVYPMPPIEVKDGDAIEAIYLKDPLQTKELTYYVKYVVGSESGEVLATKEETEDIWVLDTTYEVTAVEAKTFTGYKLKSEPDLPTDVEDDDILYVIYEEDYEQTKKLNYTVKYVVGSESGTLLASEAKSVDIWVNATSATITSVEQKTFTDYDLTTLPTLPAQVEEGDILYVIYEPAVPDIIELTYYVHYVLGDESGALLAEEEISVLIPGTADTYEVLEIAQKDFPGLRVKSTPELPVEVEQEQILYVIYEEVFGKLTVSKVVTGDLADPDEVFSFRIELDVDGEYTYNGSRSGTLSNGSVFCLKHGQSITIHGLPADATYTVTETNSAGYRVYSSNARGTIVENETVKASFTNAKSTVPVTGDRSNTFLWLGLLAVSLFGMTAALLPDRKKTAK